MLGVVRVVGETVTLYLYLAEESRDNEGRGWLFELFRLFSPDARSIQLITCNTPQPCENLLELVACNAIVKLLKKLRRSGVGSVVVEERREGGQLRKVELSFNSTG